MASVDCKYVWMNGAVVRAEQAKVSFFSHALHYGTGVFEGIRCYDSALGPAIFRLPEHLQRLRRSAAHYYMSYRYTDEELTAAVIDLIRRHNFSECYIRPLVMLGEGSLGIRPRACPTDVILAVWPWGSYLGEGAAERGVRAKIVDTRKYSARSLDPSVKAVGHYLNSVHASQEAASAGYDEAILLNDEGRIAEGAGENLFIVKKGVLITNPPHESLLLGVTRETVIELAARHGIPTKILPITVQDLHEAEEVFFTGTAAEVTPVVEVDKFTIGDGTRGMNTKILQRAYFRTVRAHYPDLRHWITMIDAKIEGEGEGETNADEC